MTFVQLPYGIFLPLAIALYWFLGKRPLATPHTSSSRKVGETAAAVSRARLWVLLLTSLGFYFFALIGQPEQKLTLSLVIFHLVLLLLMATMNYRIAIAMEQRSKGSAKLQYARLDNRDWDILQSIWNQRATQLLISGIIANVLLLVGFKYIPFLLNSIGLRESANWVSDRLIPPLGLSFFTFECIAYLVDVHRGAPPIRDWLQFSSYKLFFPKLIAGPITRAHAFIAQWPQQQFPTPHRLAEALWLIACGAAKKALIADNLGIFVDLCFGNLERAGSGDLWLATFAYGLQLYLDFSGYVDMARGSAILLGFSLPENFNAPYFSTSIADFWRRWHMTLGDWLRNYLYFPLGGSRQGLARTCLNLFLIMLIAGIWHGAAWGYVVWGILHGLALVVHRLSEAWSRKDASIAAFWSSIPGILLAWLLTQAMVFLSWIFFRLPSLDRALLVWQRFWNASGDAQFAYKVYEETLHLQRAQFAWLVAAIALLMTAIYTLRRGLGLQLSWNVKIVLVPLCLFCVWLFAPEGGLQYIYFDF
ncbi:MBOAT family protein [Oscillatoria sp. FACHB-1406]|uniref:MBOAT family O-acyltransferase n=1 Tax=Oscillatoria sp. FACHB-1406 TaxID=2692846 RepID=UPI0016880606|nr:MBOAT family protein [Oscillatoria sp. FACHB-1406]MBD2577732.1 MBOAT family protein [Oscillatoria sp. FACHB-1406]